MQEPQILIGAHTGVILAMLLYVGFCEEERQKFKDLAGKTGFEITCCYADGIGDEHEIVEKDGHRDIYPSLILLNINDHSEHWPNWMEELKSDENLRLLPTVGLGPADHEQSNLFYSMGGTSYIVQPEQSDEFERAANTVVNFWLGASEVPAPYLS